jgi:hypothetical protein
MVVLVVGTAAGVTVAVVVRLVIVTFQSKE